MAMKKKNPDPCVGVHLTLPPKLVEAVDKYAGKRGRSLLPASRGRRSQ